MLTLLCFFSRVALYFFSPSKTIWYSSLFHSLKAFINMNSSFLWLFSIIITALSSFYIIIIKYVCDSTMFTYPFSYLFNGLLHHDFLMIDTLQPFDQGLWQKLPRCKLYQHLSAFSLSIVVCKLSQPNEGLIQSLAIECKHLFTQLICSHFEELTLHEV